MPLISVIVPVYRVAAYLPKCLDSLAAQTCRDMEFILVDDGSTDDSLAICRQYAAADERFTVLTKPNGGVSSARNAGLQQASGRWIGFADGDDWLEPGMYAALIACAEQAGADVAMCGYYEYLPDPEAAPLQKGVDAAAPCGPQEALRQVLRRTGYFTAVWNKLFRREILIKDGSPVLFDETLSIGEDETWLLRVLPDIRCAAFVPQRLYHWRSRGESASRKECITPASMSVLRAKQQSEQLLAGTAPSLTPLARSRLLNDCYHLRVIAYRTGSRDALREIDGAFRRVWGSWFVSDDVPLLRKAKVLAMRLMMALRLPSRWVDWVYALRRSHG